MATRYGAAVLACVVAIVPWLLWGERLEPNPFPLLIAAVALSSWYGGLGPGIASSLVSAALLLYFYLPPKHAVGMGSVRAAVQLGGFLLVALLVSALNEQRKRKDESLERLLASEHAARMAFEASETKLRTVINASPLPMVSLDREGNVTSWNRAAVPTFGWTESELLVPSSLFRRNRDAGTVRRISRSPKNLPPFPRCYRPAHIGTPER